MPIAILGGIFLHQLFEAVIDGIKIKRDPPAGYAPAGGSLFYPDRSAAFAAGLSERFIDAP